MSVSRETLEMARKLAIKNAIDYGSAKDGAVIAKVLSKFPELKSQMKDLTATVKKVTSEVNAMPRKELESEYSKYAEEFEQAAAEKAERSAKHNFSIEGAEEGKFVTRFPPEPGGYMHIGNAKALFLEDELRRVYKGKLVLYFDDTNPDNEKQEFVDAFKDDFKWLGIKFDDEYYASDNIHVLYKYAADAIKRGGAYVCTCSTEEIQEKRLAGEKCKHRMQSMAETEAMWNKMLDGEFKDGEAILRFVGDMKSENTTMRDPTLFRIKHARHYRQGEKYFVWPTYDFCTPIMDSTRGITDVLRDKRYEMRDALYFAVLDMLGLRKPRITSFSVLEIANNVTSKRKLRELIAQKLVSGWDDPRLVTMMALRRRGITPQAIREFVLSFGMGRSESTADIDVLLSMNRKIIDEKAKRLFFIEEPIKLDVSGTASREVSLRLYPGSETDYRNYTVNGELFINAMDGKVLRKGDTVRLKDAFNVTVTGTGTEITAEYSDKDNPGKLSRIQWMTRDDAVKCELVLVGNLLDGETFSKESLRRVSGIAEGYSASLQKGDIVQFDRLGYFILDDSKRKSFISL